MGGGVAVLVRSFARIHETNLKKQGMLPLTWADAADYDRITGNDKLSILGLSALTEGVPLDVRVKPGNGAAEFEIKANHLQPRADRVVQVWFGAESDEGLDAEVIGCWASARTGSQTLADLGLKGGVV